ncbi:Putative niacin/nicotinamide transporter NaiP [Pragia fontium]|uniref:Predicted arabinose efflux permease, MFS family n=3 Tax=Pragia fontium TaxID=82985 RepID=A0AAJ4W8U5_9GAMM|nr:putative metabolite transport protein [Pragia fontium]SFC35675.1 Predicted arabinose efflux permease, MFS family [Pragia fontium DSM 5563 = ATCC 49100]SUB81972.1 Putative niacin/nicotinamide transporter NaiP [Pragia fontium]VEJ54559.1 Putative niacin/nicotinamide transporter NaiP [Pragia fontium]
MVVTKETINLTENQKVLVVEEAKRRKYAYKAVIASTVGYAMDGFDLLILGFILNAVALGLGLTTSEAGSLVTWTLVGAVVGGLFFGVLSDYYGRVKVLTWSIVLFAGFTGMCALAQGYWDLLVYRTIAGIGLGGEFGIGMALAAEACRPNERARMSSYVGLGWQAGVLAAALLTPVLLPVIGWRGMFAVGVIPALASFVIRHYIGEPEIFVKKSKEKRKGNPFKALVADTETIKASIGISILTSVQNFGYYGIMIWMPSYLSQQFNYSLTKSAMWTAVTVVGMGFGIWLFGQLADRYGRRPIFLVYQVGAALMVLGYSQLTDQYSLLIGGAVMGMFVNGMMGGYGALISEVYPTEARATAQNVLFNIGRGIGGLGPLVVGMVVSMYSFQLAIAMLASLYVLDILATLFLIPEKAGKPLE